jgi:hypothetical protein
MKYHRFNFLVFAVSLTLSTCAPTEQADIIISNTNVIDVILGKTITGQDVIINGNKIQSIKPHGESRLKSKNLIHGEGKYLIPGLWDMHVHTGNADVFFPLYIASGIAGVRDTGGGLERSSGNLSVKFQKLSVWRDEVLRGERLGPEMILAGSMIDGAPPVWPGTISVTDSLSIYDAVKAQQKLGVDFIKVYHNLNLAQLTEVARIAKEQHMSFAGHIPFSSPPLETLLYASNLGISSIEHLIQVQGAIASKVVPLNSYKEAGFAARDIINQIDQEKEKILFDTFIKNNTWLTATVSIWWGVGQLDQEHDEIFKKWLDYIPQSIAKEWIRNPFQDAELAKHPGEDYESFRKASLSMAKVARRMNDYGVNLMAGSDSANPMIIPGYGLHKELELLVDGGFAPAEALRLATINPARFLGRNDIGLLAPNYRADIVILDGNPIDNIKNTTLINSVILKGKYINREKLEHMLAEVKKISRTD